MIIKKLIYFFYVKQILSKIIQTDLIKMNQQINNHNQVSIYIPRMSINITESVVMEIFRTSNIGEVNRVDFTQINSYELMLSNYKLR